MLEGMNALFGRKFIYFVEKSGQKSLQTKRKLHPDFKT